MIVPKDFAHFVDGTYYKVGPNSTVYRFSGKTWVSSTRDIHEIRREETIQIKQRKTKNLTRKERRIKRCQLQTA